MPAALPSTCQIALKEWGSVLVAMARGEQLLLIRKGGLADGTIGFELLSDTFLFYPTFEHQAVKYLRAPYSGYLDEALQQRAPAGHVRLDLAGLVVASVQSRDATVLKRLEPFHVYNDAFLAQRLQWQPDVPLVITVVRAFRLPAPQIIPVVERYAGCKSWVELEQPVSLEGATPLLDDHVFRGRLAQLHAVLGPSIP